MHIEQSCGKISHRQLATRAQSARPLQLDLCKQVCCFCLLVVVAVVVFIARVMLLNKQLPNNYYICQ